MYSKGDTIVHPRYGTGEVLEARSVTLNGETKQYFCVALTNDRGTLMIPVDQLEDTDMRAAMTDISVIEEILQTTPEILADDHRARRATLEKRLDSSDPRKVARVIRDLAWRERVHKLTETDRKLMQRARQKVVNEIGSAPKMTLDKARKHLKALVEKTMTVHLDEAGLEVAVG